MKWTIIYFYHDQPINLKSIIDHNKENQIIDIKTYGEKKDCWYNCDRIYINNIRLIIDQIKNENVLLVEWDAHINIKIPTIEFDGMFAGRFYKPPKLLDKWWWPEITKLPEHIQPYGAGIFPFAVIGIKKHILLELIRPEYADIFNDHMFCEVRFPTLVNYLGYKIISWPKELSPANLLRGGIHTKEILELMKSNPNGIYHPVKQSL